MPGIKVDKVRQFTLSTASHSTKEIPFSGVGRVLKIGENI